jgi:hypothetical protein
VRRLQVGDYAVFVTVQHGARMARVTRITAGNVYFTDVENSVFGPTKALRSSIVFHGTQDRAWALFNALFSSESQHRREVIEAAEGKQKRDRALIRAARRA